MKRYVMWSGGEDSTATIILCYILGIKIDGVVMSEVMFDHKRGISGENPKHIEWVYKTAIPKIESFGYKVIVLRDKSDYMQEFYHKVKASKEHPEREGKYRGFFIGGMCAGNDRLKMRPIRQFLKKQKEEVEEIVGICYDESIRLMRLKKGKRSILAELKISKERTSLICDLAGLRSPTYKTENRGGCWFCPNQSIQDFARLKKEYPFLWEELQKMANSPNKVSECFRREKTFKQIDREVDLINNQISIFDCLEGV